MSDTINFLDKREVNRINTLLLLGMVQCPDRVSFVYKNEVGEPVITISNTAVRHYSTEEIRRFYCTIMNLKPKE
jgi:hypothetical protein